MSNLQNIMLFSLFAGFILLEFALGKARGMNASRGDNILDMLCVALLAGSLVAVASVMILGWLVGLPREPLSPLVAGFNPRRFILAAELGIAALLGVLAYYVGADQFSTTPIIGCLILLSLFAAAHDFALDGYFVASLDDKRRATHSGILNVATKVGVVLAGPGLIWLVGRIMDYGPQTADAWSWALATAGILALLTLVANAWGLAAEPTSSADTSTVRERFREMLAGLNSLLVDRRLLAVLALILFYRASEVHMARIIPVFATKAAL